ncbi:MAG: tetratricopeptide (TPR) repeat protein [Oleispira sp.]|jgi:tetratricopeptide (TPR) repeat protein
MLKNLLILCVTASFLTLVNNANAEDEVKLRDLKYGTILFDYYQQNYFSSLIGYEVANSRGELNHQIDEARLLHGGMTLSYGLPDEAESIFKQLLNTNPGSDRPRSTANITDEVRNKAWFYLAKMYYQKGEAKKAATTLGFIHGDIPKDIHNEFNYLATLINIRNNNLDSVEKALSSVMKGSVFEPYLIFNLASSQLKKGNMKSSAVNFQRVIEYGKRHPQEEFLVLADRAIQALAYIDVEQGNLMAAWLNLQFVRTTGLYSNRALLSYGWTAIKLERFDRAIPALSALDRRSISIAEVQEAKVLLAHIYEQQGAPRTALKQYLLAERAFAGGIESIDSARRIIAGQRIPEEFVINLDAMMDETDWYGSQPTLDYNKLTPFLIELMSSNSFHSVLKELRDLYALRENLNYWSLQAKEHQLIISHRHQGWSSESLHDFVSDSRVQKEAMEIQISELGLHAKTLSVKEQNRFAPLLEATKDDFKFLDTNFSKIEKIKKPYQESEETLRWMERLHKRIKQEQQQTERMIDKLENVMRIVVNAELDKHEERMRYYWAQARLGKARLYDQTLNTIEKDALQQAGPQ